MAAAQPREETAAQRLRLAHGTGLAIGPSTMLRAAGQTREVRSVSLVLDPVLDDPYPDKPVAKSH
jgi:hypothetical protein